MIGKKRTWGRYWVLWNAKHFKVKLLRFHGRCDMSVQYHNQRSELWLFLSGKNKGEFMHIPERRLHTFSSEEITYVLEIQYGEICDEKDIVRV